MPGQVVLSVTFDFCWSVGSVRNSFAYRKATPLARCPVICMRACCVENTAIQTTARIREESMDKFNREARLDLRKLKGVEDRVSSSFGCVMSDLLTIREKTTLINLLEPQCKFIKTTVAQIMKAKDTKGESPGWHRLHCGVVCLVENRSARSYFLRLYCVMRAKLLWEEELYIPCKYTASCAYFHTFPAEAHHVGFNFANETEAEEFYSAVRAVHQKMTTTINMTKKEVVSHSASNLPTLKEAKSDCFYEEPTISTAPLTTSSLKFLDLDPAMISLLTQAKLSEEDLRNKDVTEVVDCIITQFGGLKAVQTELRRKSTGSKTLPRMSGLSITAALQKGPLPPVPPVKTATNSQQMSQDTCVLNTNPPDSTVSFTPPSPTTGRLRRSASLKDVGSFAAVEAAEGMDPIIVALREVFKQRKMLLQNTSEGPDETAPQTN